MKRDVLKQRVCTLQSEVLAIYELGLKEAKSADEITKKEYKTLRKALDTASEILVNATWDLNAPKRASIRQRLALGVSRIDEDDGLEGLAGIDL